MSPAIADRSVIPFICSSLQGNGGSNSLGWPIAPSSSSSSLSLSLYQAGLRSISSLCLSTTSVYRRSPKYWMPRHPFRIFKSRFNQAPELIIYDNACRLHIYSLNREPQFFQNTKFLVDRFHWRGHVGCSRGYCLDAYNDKRIRAINSQVNEQANSGLQRIRGQLAYMSVNNFKLHCSLFLALKNMDKMSVLSVTNLVL